MIGAEFEPGRSYWAATGPGREAWRCLASSAGFVTFRDRSGKVRRCRIRETLKGTGAQSAFGWGAAGWFEVDAGADRMPEKRQNG